jgi:chromosome segregation ATPase
MDKRQDLEKQRAKFISSKERIENQLKELESSVKQMQAKVNDEMMESGTSGSLQELSNTREKVNSLRQALDYANGQISETQQQLNDYDRAAIGGQIQKLDHKMIQAVIDLQEKIGEVGLKGQIDQLGALIIEIDMLTTNDVMVHDVDQHLRAARAIYTDLSRSLLEYWKRIEELKWGPAHSTNSTREGYLPGFGVLPGYIKSL